MEGILLSLALFLVNRYQDRQRQIQDDTIRDYLEWLRRENHKTLTDIINAQRHKLDTLLKEIEDLQDVYTRINTFIETEFSDLRSQLKELAYHVQPPILSVFPLGGRLIADRRLFYRDRELETLIHSSGDLILSGQPGTGKTFLLFHYAKHVDARFIVSKDPDNVISSLRYNCPDILIVDDAGTQDELIERLCHFRYEHDITFRLIAVCWPYETEHIRALLDCPQRALIDLQLFTSDQMAELIRKQLEYSGLIPETRLVREIRQQADGRPGLAIRLVALISREQDIRPLLNASVYYTLLEHAFCTLKPHYARYILTAFAVGGEAGMRVDDVTDVLHMSRAELSHYLQTLATGGIISQTADDTIVTRPAAFRHALLKREFLSRDPIGNEDLVYELFERAPHPVSAVKTLIHSVAKGAKLNDDWLLCKAEQVHDPTCWNRLAGVSRDWCNRVFQKLGGPAEYIARPSLHYIPEEFIPALLDEPALSDDRAACLKFVEDLLVSWVKQFDSVKQGLERRRILFKATKDWLAKSGDSQVAWRILPVCVSLAYEKSEFDAGAGRTFSWTHGTLPGSAVKELTPIWEEFVTMARIQPPLDWKRLRRSMEQWIHPESVSRTDEARQLWKVTRPVMTSFVKHLIRDFQVSTLGLVRWAIYHGLISEECGDPEFLAYCPPEWPLRKRESDFEDIHEQWRSNARRIGLSWSSLSPQQVGEKLSRFEQECDAWDIGYPLSAVIMAETIAENVTDCEAWLTEFFKRGLQAEVLLPFVKEMTEEAAPARDDWLKSLLQDSKYCVRTLELVLGTESVSSSLNHMVKERLQKYPDATEFWFMAGRVSSSWTWWLADNATGRLALDVALGDIRSEDQQLLTTDRQKWITLFSSGVAEINELDPKLFSDLEDVVKQVPEVRLPLVEALLSNTPAIESDLSKPYKVLFESLDHRERLSLIPGLENVWAGDLVALLVGDDIDAYDAFLNEDRLRHHHLKPLAGDPATEDWQNKAVKAYEHEYPPSDIASAVLGTIWTTWGSMSAYYEGWVEKFQELAQSGDVRLRDIGESGKEIFADLAEKERERETLEDVLGLDAEE